MHSDFIVFADESGDHSLANINADYPVFVLAFCVFRRTEYFQTVCPLLQQFKLRWWIHDGVVLHSLRIRRQEQPFPFLKSLDTREQFMTDLTDTLSNCPFTLIAAVIDNEENERTQNWSSLLSQAVRRRESTGEDAGILDRILRQESEPDWAAGG